MLYSKLPLLKKSMIRLRLRHLLEVTISRNHPPLIIDRIDIFDKGVLWYLSVGHEVDVPPRIVEYIIDLVYLGIWYYYKIGKTNKAGRAWYNANGIADFQEQK